VAKVLDELRPYRTLAVESDLLGAHVAKDRRSFELDKRAFETAKKFGASHHCDFRFDPVEGAGIFTKLDAS